MYMITCWFMLCHLKNDKTNYNRNNMNTIWIGLGGMYLESYSLTLEYSDYAIN